MHRKDLRENRHHSSKLQRAWNKYGEDSFVFELVERVDDRNNLLKIEQVWLDWEDCANEGYNILAKAASALGVKRSEETRARIRAARAKQTFSPETLEKLRVASTGNQWNVGYKHSDEARQNMSDSKRGNVNNKGRKYSEESRIRITIRSRATKRNIKRWGEIVIAWFFGCPSTVPASSYVVTTWRCSHENCKANTNYNSKLGKLLCYRE